MRQRMIAAFVALTMFFSPMVALADECTGVVPTPRSVEVDGMEWIALPPDQMACLSKRAEQKEKADGVIAAQEREIDLQIRQVWTATRALSAMADVAKAQEKRGDDYKTLSEKQAEHIEDLEAWYRSPLFWTGIGAAGAIVVAALLKGALGGSGANTTIIER